MNGEIVRDRYRLIELVGRGGEGSLWRAHDAQHDRPVALKVRDLQDGAQRDRILAEARTLLEIAPHRNLPQVRDDFFDGDRYFLVADWIEGSNLDGVTLAADEAVDLLRPIATALDHLASNSPPIVHGDVKPANIIRTPDGRAVLVDFGIAMREGTASILAGTSGFVAPDVVLSPAADVYGLAATFFALVSGAPPGGGARPGWLDLPAERAKAIDVTMRRALSTDPSRRPASATAFIEALATKSEIPNNLPLPVSTFVGREREIDEIVASLQTARLVTLHGPGGIGKTRLAVEAALELLDTQPDGCWLVSLAALNDPALLTQEITSALGVREEPGTSLLDALVQHCAARQLILVIDNCEHMLDACARLVDDVLKRCRRVRILATSREQLGVTGESIYRVPSLAESSTLFVQRARLVNHSFVPTPAVDEICRRLDNIPLAIELAAARARHMPAEVILSRLDDALRLLTGGDRSAQARQQTLRALVDWSYNMLSETERTVFDRASVFAGGFSQAAAESVCAGGDVDGYDVIELLSSLADKSLIEVTVDGPRYRMLETLRAYGSERLGDSAAEVRARHLAWVRALVESAELEGPAQSEWLATLERENDNVRAALDFGIGFEDSAAAAVIATGLYRFWQMRGLFTEGRRWLDRLMAVESPKRAQLLRVGGVLAYEQGDYGAARPLLDDALQESRSSNDQRFTARVLNDLGVLEYARGDYAAARARLGEALDIMRELSDERAVGISLANLGVLSMEANDLVAAKAQTEESKHIFERLGDRMKVAIALSNLAIIANRTGDAPTSSRFHNEALTIFRELGDRTRVAGSLDNLATLMLDQGELRSARILLEEACAIRHELGARRGEARALGLLATVTRLEGNAEAARSLARSSLRIQSEIGDLKAALDSIEEYAFSHPDPNVAAKLLAATTAGAQQLGSTRDPGAQQRRERAIREIRVKSGAELDRIWGRDDVLSIQDAITAVLSEAQE